MTLAAFAAKRRAAAAERRRPPLSIDVLHAGRSAANPPHTACSGCRMIGQTDGRTEVLPLHRPCSANYAGSVKKKAARKITSIILN